MASNILALSRQDAQRFRSQQSYVVISVTDVGAKRPYIHPHAAMKARLQLFFDDILPEDACRPDGTRIYFEMHESHANRIAAFVEQWWDRVETLVVHCHAGLSRSTGIAAAVAEHFGLPTDAFFAGERFPNAHCRALVAAALRARDPSAPSA